METIPLLLHGQPSEVQTFRHTEHSSSVPHTVRLLDCGAEFEGSVHNSDFLCIAEGRPSEGFDSPERGARALQPKYVGDTPLRLALSNCKQEGSGMKRGRRKCNKENEGCAFD